VTFLAEGGSSREHLQKGKFQCKAC